MTNCNPEARFRRRTSHAPNLSTPPARRAWRSYKFAPFLFLFFVSKVGLPLMGYTAVQYTDCQHDF